MTIRKHLTERIFLAVASFILFCAILAFTGCTPTVTYPSRLVAWSELAGPIPVRTDPYMLDEHEHAVQRAITLINLACDCAFFGDPTYGQPIYRQEVPGAPDRGVVYVRDDGSYDPHRAHTKPFHFSNGKIFSVEVMLPRYAEQRDWFAREWTPEELTAMTIHELGHAAGLGHSLDKASALYPRLLAGQSLTQADREMLKAAYRASRR